MLVAPRPMRPAHLKPRRAPSFMMVRLTGPTGMERRSPLMNPVNAAKTIGGRLNMARNLDGRILQFVFFFVVGFDLMPDFARNTRADESVKKVQGEKERKHEN